MFNNRQSRRRFRLGNLARLVQLRQNVSQQPPPPRMTLQETLSQSPPQSPPPTQFLSPIPSTSTVPFIESRQNSGGSPPQPKSSPLSPLSPKPKEESQSQPMPPLMSKHVETHRSLLIHSPPTSPLIPPLMSKHVKTHRNLLIESPPNSPQESTESLALVPPTPTTPQAKTPLSPPSTLKPTEESHSQRSPRSPPWQASPPSLPEPESQMPLPPPEAKAPSSSPLTLDANEEFNSKTSPPSSSSINETRFRPSPPTLPETSQAAMTPPPSSPSTLNANEEFQSQPSPLPSKPTDENISQSISPPPALSESHPPLAEAKSSPSTTNTNENFQSSLLTPKSINETRFRLSPPSKVSPPPPSGKGDTQPPSSPSEAKNPPSRPPTLNAVEKPQPLTPSKSINETRFRSPLPSEALPPSLSKSSESQPSSPKANIPTLDATDKSQPPPFLPSKSINQNMFRSSPLSPSSLSKSGESQLPLPPEVNVSPSTLNATEKSKSPPQPLLPSKSFNQTLSRSSLLSEATSPSLAKSGESQPPFQSAETKTPLSPSSTPKNANQESQSQPLLPSKSPILPKTLPPSSSDSVESQSSLPSSKAKNLLPSPSMLKAKEDFRSETEAKIPPSLPSTTTLNDTEKSQHQLPPPLLPSKSIHGTRSQSLPPSTYTENPNSTPPPLLSSKAAAENLRSQSPMLPPPLTAPSKMKTPIPSLSTSPATITAPPQPLSSPKPSLPQTEPKPIESHTSPDHNKDLNHNSEKRDAKLMNKVPTCNEEPEPENITGKINNKNRGKAIWSEEPIIMMFINSNVQGLNTSLSLDSSSIDHEPGVHLTIDSGRSCDFSSKVF